GGGSGASSTPTQSGSAKSITGAGSSLVYPLLSNWIPDYNEKTAVTVTYGPIGSGGGIEAITGRTVDFGASDAPITPDQAKGCADCVQIPWALSATTVPYNVDGAPAHLRLTGPIVAGIFLGTIRSWNDPRIAAANPGADLPDQRITPVFRSDSS